MHLPAALFEWPDRLVALALGLNHSRFFCYLSKMDKQYLIDIYKVEAEKYNKTRDIHWKIKYRYLDGSCVGHLYSITKQSAD
jgi:hypothetical protein